MNKKDVALDYSFKFRLPRNWYRSIEKSAWKKKVSTAKELRSIIELHLEKNKLKK